MGGHAAHAGGEAGFYAAFYFVVGLVGDDGFHQVVPFVLVGRAVVGGLPELVLLGFDVAFVEAGRRSAVAALGGDGAALGAVDEAVVDAGCAVDAAAVEEHPAAVGEG